MSATVNGGCVTHWALMMAGAVIVMLPLIVIFFLGQRLFIQGIVMTGLKG